MKQIDVSLSIIEEKAVQLSREKKSWHFHILTKDCSLNRFSGVALILENPESDELYVSICSEKPMDLGKRLVEMLHGKDITKKTHVSTDLPAAAKKIIDRAKELSGANIPWHHHMLFPNCVFNTHPGCWTIVFEDPEHNTVLESFSADEPKPVLKELEAIFYTQRP